MCFFISLLATEILFSLAVGAAFGLGFYYVFQPYQQEVVFVEYVYDTPYYLQYQNPVANPVAYTEDGYIHSNYGVQGPYHTVEENY